MPDGKASLHTQLWQDVRVGGRDVRTFEPSLQELRAETTSVGGVGRVPSQLICARQGGMSVEHLETCLKSPIG